MQCDLCGKKVESGFKIELEGSQMFACDNCSKMGKIVKKISPEIKVKKKQEEKEEDSEINEELKERIKPDETDKVLDFVDNFGEVLKQKRNAMGLSQDDLAKKINIKSSVIHHIESGNRCDFPTAQKIERALKIKLLDFIIVGNAQAYKSKKENAFTLGDLIKNKIKK